MGLKAIQHQSSYDYECDQCGKVASSTTTDQWAQPLPAGWLHLPPLADAAGDLLVQEAYLCPNDAQPWLALAQRTNDLLEARRNDAEARPA